MQGATEDKTMAKIKDDLIELQRKAHLELCSREPKNDTCEFCKGEGVIMKDEWTGTDTNYEVAVRCVCNEH